MSSSWFGKASTCKFYDRPNDVCCHPTNPHEAGTGSPPCSWCGDYQEDSTIPPPELCTENVKLY